MSLIRPGVIAASFLPKSIRWLQDIERHRSIKIQHARNGGEVVLRTQTGYKLFVDGFSADTHPPTVFEYHGDYWHANPDRFPLFDLHRDKGKANIEVYMRTKWKEWQILKLGYNLETRWECEDEGFPPPSLTFPPEYLDRHASPACALPPQDL